MTTKSVSLLSALAVSTFLLSGCGRSESSPAHASSFVPQTHHLATAQVTREALPTTRSFPGTVRALNRAVLASRVPGQIAAAPFEVGDRVEVGRILITLDTAELDARVAQAEAAFDQVRRDLTRETKLLAQNASTAEKVRTLEDAERGAVARLNEARTMRAYATIAAPFDGVVAEKFATVGDQANPGQPLLRLEGTDAFEVVAQVPASLPKISLEEHLTIVAGEHRLDGILTALTASVDPTTRSRRALVKVPTEASLAPGDFVRVEWPETTTPLLNLPQAAVRHVGQLSQVFVLGENSQVSLRLVRLGRSLDDRFEVQTGVVPGETVVLNPPSALRDGDKVEVLP